RDPRPGDRRDDPGVDLDAADPVVAGVGDDQVPVAVEDDALGPVYPGLGGRPAVAAIAAVAALADHGRDDLRAVVDPADHVIGAVGDEQIAVGGYGGGVGAAEGG